mmetsp:Transcript_7609/g.11926  ORF Transcript_7609/g.11926 Transcript_7609/m.11926 type:complete len:287 (+) Transcript_7609:74-934(+)
MPTIRLHVAMLAVTLVIQNGDTFLMTTISSLHRTTELLLLKSWTDNEWNDSSNWKSSTGNDVGWENNDSDRKEDGLYWSEFESSDETTNEGTNRVENDDAKTETMLDTLAVLQTDESTYNAQEARRADSARMMEEWGFDASTIAAALNNVVDDKQPNKEDDEELLLKGMMQGYQEESYVDNYLDPQNAESHDRVQIDEVTKEPVRSQMVYVDEHACIGCTNCAMVAQSTFFMEEEKGRARSLSSEEMTRPRLRLPLTPVPSTVYIMFRITNWYIWKSNDAINISTS